MNWGRYIRAMRARRVQYVEALRQQGIRDADSLTPDDWAAVAEHDQLLEQLLEQYGD